MGRRRKAWLFNGDGRRRYPDGRRCPGYYVRWSEYTATGRRINRTHHCWTQHAAREWVRRHNARLDLALLGQLIPTTIDEAAREFLTGCRALAAATRIHYASTIGLLARRLGRQRELHTLTGTDIDGFIAWRLRHSRPATVAKHIRNLRRFFNWAISRDYAERNPIHAATSRPPDNLRRDRPHVTDVQLGQLARSLDTPDRRLAFWLALTTGLDRGQLEQLTAAQIALDAAMIRFTRAKTREANVVPIHRSLLPDLRRRCAHTAPGKPLLQGLSRQARQEDWWHRARCRAGLPGLLFRDLRAIATARLCRQPGITLGHAQQLLGHASLETTARHYLPVDPALRAALDSLRLPGHPAPAKRRTN